MMKAICVALVSLSSAAALAGNAEVQGITMVMRNSIDSPAAEGALVDLQAVDGQQCRYLGELIQVRPAESALEKMIALGGGNAGEWAIAINQESCSEGQHRAVNLRAPLKVMPGEEDYRVGYKLMAYPVEI